MTMKRISLLIAISLVSVIFSSSCGLFDSRIEWRGGPYALMWIDIPDDVFVARDEGNGSWSVRVEERVFAVGWNGRYLIAQQHPKGDKKVTNYFIIDAQQDERGADAKKAVMGPLTETEFMKRSARLHLPQFTNVLASLK